MRSLLPARRRPLRTAATVLTIIAIAAGAVVAQRHARDGREPADRAREATWRALVTRAAPAPVPGTASPPPDGLNHFIVTVESTSAARTVVGPDGTRARWVRLSGRGTPARLTDRQQRELLPWARAFTTDDGGATWIRIADEAPAALGPRAPGVEDSLASLPDAKLTRIDDRTWGVTTGAGRAAVARLRGVKTVGDDPMMWIVGAEPVSDDTFASYQWALRNNGDSSLRQPGDMAAGADANVPGAWTRARGRGVVVAVTDQPVDFAHPDLADRLWTNPDEPCNATSDMDGDGLVGACHGWDFVADNGTSQLRPVSAATHGSHVTGIIAATAGNGLGIAGVAPGATIMPLAVGDASGRVYVSSAVAAINYAVAHGASVINASWGGLGTMPPILQAAIDRAEAAGVVFVAAAGNNGVDTSTHSFFPGGARNANVITVGATDALDRPASFSNYSATKVSVFAPGYYLLSTLPTSVNGGYGMMSGTSMAAPMVAGQAALLKSLDPSLTAVQIKERIMASARRLPSLTGKAVSGARIDVLAAAEASLPPRSPRFDFDGFDALDVTERQQARLLVGVDTPTADAHPEVDLLLTLAARVEGEAYAVADFAITVTLPNGERRQVVTDDEGTATIAGIPTDVMRSTADLGVDLGVLPAGLYAIGATLADSGAPVGGPGRIVFAIADHEVAPAPPAPTAPTTGVPAPTTAPNVPAPTPTAPVPTTVAPTVPTTEAPPPAPAPTPAPGPAPSTAPATPGTAPNTAPAAPGPASTTAPAPPGTAAPSPPAAPADPRAGEPPPSPTTATTPGAPTSGTPTTAPDAPRPAPPDTPDRLRATAGDGAATLEWEASAGAVGYRVYRDGELAAQTLDTSMTIGGLAPGREYTFAVSAYSEWGESARTPAISLVPALPATTAAAPVGPPEQVPVTTSPPATSPAPPTTDAAPDVPREVYPPGSAVYIVRPDSGPTSGGTFVSIAGGRLADVSVEIDGAVAPVIARSGSGWILVRTGPHQAAGTYDIRMHGSTFDIVLEDAFTYVADAPAPPPTTATTVPAPSPTTTPVTAPAAPPPPAAPPTTTPPSTSPPGPAPPAPDPEPTTPATDPPATTPTTRAPLPASPVHLAPLPPGHMFADWPPTLWGGMACRRSRCAG